MPHNKISSFQGTFLVVVFVYLLSLISPHKVVAQTSQTPSLEHSYHVSLLISDGVDDEVYAIYGHAALRLKNVDNPEDDNIYNWGVFDFDAPNFVGKFISGKTTDYMLACGNASAYIYDYTYSRETNVHELVLDLTQQEVEKLVLLLQDNLQPQNIYYHYNFVFDNCATRPFEIIENAIDGKLILPSVEPITTREMLDKSSRLRPWLKLGTDLALGSLADQPTVARDQVFLPEHLKEMLCQAKVQTSDGSLHPLVKEQFTYPRQAFTIPPVSKTPLFLRPMTLTIALLLVTLFLAVRNRYLKKQEDLALKIWSTLCYIGMGIAGGIIYYLSFFSLHPLVYPNWNILVFHPFYILLLLPCIWITNKRYSHYTHALNIVAIVVFYILCFCPIQHFSPVVLLLAFNALLIATLQLATHTKKACIKGKQLS